MVGSSRLQAEFRTGQADLGQSGPDGRLASDERGTAGGTALLAIPVGEHRTFFGDAVDVRGAVPHDAVIVGADVEPADVIAPDDQDVRLFRCSHKFPLTNRVTGMRSKPYADFGVGVCRPGSNGARRTCSQSKVTGRPWRAARVKVIPLLLASLGRASAAYFGRHLGFHGIEVEARAALHRRVFEEGLEFLAHHLLDEHKAPELILEPVEVLLRRLLSSRRRASPCARTDRGAGW